MDESEKYKFEFTFQELTVIEESLLRFCSYWNNFYGNLGKEYGASGDERTEIGNELHDKIFKLID